MRDQHARRAKGAYEGSLFMSIARLAAAPIPSHRCDQQSLRTRRLGIRLSSLSVPNDPQVTDFGDSLSFKARAMIFDRIFKAIAEGG